MSNFEDLFPRNPGWQMAPSNPIFCLLSSTEDEAFSIRVYNNDYAGDYTRLCFHRSSLWAEPSNDDRL